MPSSPRSTLGWALVFFGLRGPWTLRLRPAALLAVAPLWALATAAAEYWLILRRLQPLLREQTPYWVGLAVHVASALAYTVSFWLEGGCWATTASFASVVGRRPPSASSWCFWPAWPCWAGPGGSRRRPAGAPAASTRRSCASSPTIMTSVCRWPSWPPSGVTWRSCGCWAG